MVAEQDLKEIIRILLECSQGNVLSLADQKEIAEKFDCLLCDIEKIALEHSIVPARFTRNSLSCHEQLRLFQSRVAIIGCGGLGGRTAELLARIGIGHLTLTDPDIFSESNLNRQIFCNAETLGYNKVEVISSELQKINPVLTTDIHINTFDAASVAEADIVIDGLDSATARKDLVKLCQKQNIPIVHGAVKEWYGQIGVDRSANNLVCSLYPQATNSATAPNVMPMTVALLAAMQAAEVCKFLLGKGSLIDEGWLQCDLLFSEYDHIKNTLC
ncbi:MAG TPA: HesA/MoeB/ThiF family protein [Desulfobacterales bacterium]|nr:HesA/MoeB/ThiF family protein [Desulfobacterales bacterium]HIP40288.1 HesA/MoeB/ThiF family protein [Desulfocapsa sulfexigens]